MYTSNSLIEKVLNECNLVNERAKAFLNLSHAQLNWKVNPYSWSAGECFEHLVITNHEYIPVFEKAARHSIQNENDYTFKPTFIGKFILKSVMPEFKWKMKTTKSFDPKNSNVDINIVNNFLNQHEQIKELIFKCRGVDLKKVKVQSPFNKLVKYNLGDSFLIIVYHDLRHLQQAEKVVNSFNFTKQAANLST